MSVNHRESLPDQTENDQESIVASFFDELEAAEDPQEPSEEPVDDEAGDPTGETPEDAPEASEEPPSVVEEEDDEEEKSEDENSAEEDPVEKRFRHMQSLHDRQLNEVRAQLDAMNQWAQQVYQSQMAQHQAQMQAQMQVQEAPNPYQHVTDAQIADGVKGDLVTTFRTIVQYRPDKVAKTIAMARETYGNEVGDEMQVEYNSYLVHQQAAAAEARFAEIASQREEEQAPAQIRDTMNSIIASVAQQYGEAFTAVQPEFVERVKANAPLFREYMDSNGYEMTPDAVHHFMVSIFNDIREEKLNEAANKPRKARKTTPQQHVETSTSSSGTRPEDMSADELAINEILQGAAYLDIEHTAPTQ